MNFKQIYPNNTNNCYLLPKPADVLESKLKRYEAEIAKHKRRRISDDHNNKKNQRRREKSALRVSTMSPQEHPPPPLLEMQEGPMCRLIKDNATRSRDGILLNFSKGELRLDTVEGIEAIKALVKDNPEFEELDPKFSLLQMIELAVKHEVSGAKDLLDELKSQEFSLQKYEGTMHLTSLYRSPVIQVKDLRRNVVRSITRAELIASKCMTLTISGVGTEQSALDSGECFFSSESAFRHSQFFATTNFRKILP